MPNQISRRRFTRTGTLHRNRNYRPVTETLEMLLRETRAHLAFALRPSGEQVLANVLHIAELARKYEANGGRSFRGFVEELRFGGDAIETGEAPIFEEGSEGIRMMSVHKAKGLEFPIVILADITANLCSPRPNRHIDSSRSLCAAWRAECAYNQPDDYVFASIKMHGKQPIWPNSAMEDHIRPAAKRAGADYETDRLAIRSDTRSVRCSKRTVKMWRRCKH